MVINLTSTERDAIVSSFLWFANRWPDRPVFYDIGTEPKPPNRKKWFQVSIFLHALASLCQGNTDPCWFTLRDLTVKNRGVNVANGNSLAPGDDKVEVLT